MKQTAVNRRKALAGFGSLAAVSALAQQNISKQNPGPKLVGEAPGRIAPREDMANVLEFEDVASRMLASPAYAPIAGGDRTFFDRITLRPRMMINTLEMDMSVGPGRLPVSRRRVGIAVGKEHPGHIGA